MKNNVVITICLLSGLLFTSCSDKLNRKKAEKSIREFYEYPNLELTKIYNKLDNSIWGWYKDDYQFLSEQELITIETRRGGIWGPYRYVYLTSKGEAYTIEDYKKGDKYILIASKRDFYEVTGISFEDENNAKVEFVIERVEVTPFGKINDFKKGDTLSYSVKMKKYDDGWRIMDKRPENISPDDYPAIFAPERKLVKRKSSHSTLKLDVFEFEGRDMINGIYVFGDAFTYDSLSISTNKNIFVSGVDEGSGSFENIGIVKKGGTYYILKYTGDEKHENVEYEGHGFKVTLNTEPKKNNSGEIGEIEVSYKNEKLKCGVHSEYAAYD